MENKPSIEYLAGFFDGEGCIKISRSHTTVSGSPRYNLSIKVGNINQEVIKAFGDRWGGKYYILPESVKRGNRQIFYEWFANSKVSKIVLNEMFPYLIVKKIEAKVALDFQKNKEKIFAGHHSRRYYTKEEVASIASYRDKLCSLRKAGHNRRKFPIGIDSLG